MKRIFNLASRFGTLTVLGIVLLLASASCSRRAATQAHADWTYDAVLYEMNVRQFTPEGTFAAAAQQLPRLRDLGVDIVWLMPIHPIGEKGRKGSLGSYYAIRDYMDVNPEMGTMADFEQFLDRAHELGLRVILDYVANHTSPDAAWVTERPAEWYVRDSTGAPAVQYDWTDIAKLNYETPGVRDAMLDVLTFWVGKGVDGFRCDVAMEVPHDYWEYAFAQIRAIRPDLFLLAEAEGPQFHADGFDATYAWDLHHVLNDIAQGKKSAADLRVLLAKYGEEFPASAYRMMFTSNHDENSWNGTEFERMGDAAATMAALTYVLPQSLPLIYTGQEIGYDHRFAFFEKDPVPAWEPNEWSEFYKRLNALRHANPALAGGERGGEMTYMGGAVADVMAFTRTAGDNKVVCLFNLSGSPQAVIPTVEVGGDFIDAMTGEPHPIVPGEEFSLGPWEYLILINN
ncbi:alpha-amylase family glycosyl hydrolase [uncultured Alistipes sp.]|jgi:glycosidase|uniref:alpha-amylase family glycosyl hydrolase n=1 Tax=uncultured Alistipes sp. TaxID=538949 RepID=UPI0025DDEF25|nr:alpha-amylase family glycosyl hydrolase [uncultured Alistipes sp.]